MSAGLNNERLRVQVFQSYRLEVWHIQPCCQDGPNVCRWLPCRGCPHQLRTAEPPSPCARKHCCRHRTRSDQLSQGGPPCPHASWGAYPGFLQGDVAALCAAIRVWTIGQTPIGAADLDQLVCDAKTLRGSIEPTAVAALR
jgi:hypothetical protein